eukprot:982115-Prorocentrum_lima.AAC.1
MTSSLVGSEMCIRDSVSPNDSTPAAYQACRHWAKAEASVAAWDCASIPVSYTHLTLPTICSV